MPHQHATHCPLCGSRLEGTQWEGRQRPRCQGCGFVYFFNPASAAAGLVLDVSGGRVLLVRRRIEPHKGCWALPAGYQEIDEEPQAAVRREVREETGLELGQLALVDLYSGPEFFREYPNGDQVFLVGAVYTTQDMRGEPIPDEREALELRFFDLKALPCDLVPPSRPFLERCRQKLASAGT